MRYISVVIGKDLQLCNDDCLEQLGLFFNAKILGLWEAQTKDFWTKNTTGILGLQSLVTNTQEQKAGNPR